MIAHDEAISKSDFERLRTLIYAHSGITLAPDKKAMLELRIKRRLRTLELHSFSEYCEYLFGAQGQKEEILHLLNVVTTNKTDFFREPEHFDFLVKKAIPEILASHDRRRELLIWSAGCSSGEEPYTLAIVLHDYGSSHPGFRFRILATDLSTTVLAKAERAIFDCEVVKPVPPKLRQKYFLRSRDRNSKVTRVAPELRRLVEFRRLNFMDSDFGIAQKVDAVFCRNVIIYFDRPTQERIIQKLTNQLLPGGYFFVGHSENLHGMDVPLTPVAPALYRKKGAKGGTGSLGDSPENGAAPKRS